MRLAPLFLLRPDPTDVELSRLRLVGGKEADPPEPEPEEEAVDEAELMLELLRWRKLTSPLAGFVVVENCTSAPPLLDAP